MEHSLLAACVCLVFGCCIENNEDYQIRLQNALPQKSFVPLIEMLVKLRDFAHLAVSTFFGKKLSYNIVLTQFQDIMTQKGKDRVTRILAAFQEYNRKVVEPPGNMNPPDAVPSG